MAAFCITALGCDIAELRLKIVLSHLSHKQTYWSHVCCLYCVPKINFGALVSLITKLAVFLTTVSTLRLDWVLIHLHRDFFVTIVAVTGRRLLVCVYVCTYICIWWCRLPYISLNNFMSCLWRVPNFRHVSVFVLLCKLMNCCILLKVKIWGQWIRIRLKDVVSDLSFPSLLPLYTDPGTAVGNRERIGFKNCTLLLELWNIYVCVPR
jgi:hypothetical protein